ncbi:GNAT family N-acetyltransferase [Flavobacterium sp.]|uniref:GNAT family N-acetyltransferase n=1 Tax=Flavobacterium sp. TaxID=239 RepID=UPI003527F5D5
MQTELKTNRIVLRVIAEDDINAVYQGLSNPDVIRYYGVSFDSLAATQEQMKWFAQKEQKWFAICSLKDGTFYGACGLNTIDLTHQKAEVGLWLLPDFWGKGLMQEAIAVLCQYGFDTLGLHRIEGFVDTRNAKCIHALTKAGFVYEGTMQDCERKNDTFVSISIYALLHNCSGV